MLLACISAGANAAELQQAVPDGFFVDALDQLQRKLIFLKSETNHFFSMFGTLFGVYKRKGVLNLH